MVQSLAPGQHVIFQYHKISQVVMENILDEENVEDLSEPETISKGAHFTFLTALFVTLFRNKSVTKSAVREVKCAPSLITD